MLEEMSFTLDDFARSKWRDVIASVEKRTCESYSTLFEEESKKAREDDDALLSEVYLLLHAVCYLWLRPEEKHQPFAPWIQWANGRRSVDIVDFSESHLQRLKEIYGLIDDPELKSRIGDVVWTYDHRGNFLFAETAVNAYLQAGESFLLTDEYYYGTDRFTRAIHLAASLGRNSRKFSEVVVKIEDLINQYALANSPFVGRFLDLLYEYRQGDCNKYGLIAESLARVSQDRHEWGIARNYWHGATLWYQLCENPESVVASRLQEAECYVFEAEDFLQSDRGMSKSVAAHHLQSAIEALRQIPGTEVRQEELHKQMLELQESSLDELKAVSGNVDLTMEVEKSLKAVKDKPFIEALFAFCSLGSPPRVKSLRETVEQMTARHPLSAWISTNVINDRGRVVGRRGSIFSETPEESEAAKIAEMHRWARYEKDVLAIIIEAVRFQLTVEHKFELHDFLELTANHPFIPPAREIIFTRGFQAGFQGEYLEALHLLVPQVENSLRYLLNRQGVITSRLSSEGIQEEMDLNALLEVPRLVEILGEDIVFDLKGSLTSRFGFNFRNLMAHGLLQQNAFYSHAAIYIWWMLLRIICLPFIIAQGQEENKHVATPSE